MLKAFGKYYVLNLNAKMVFIGNYLILLSGLFLDIMCVDSTFQRQDSMNTDADPDSTNDTLLVVDSLNLNESADRASGSSTLESISNKLPSGDEAHIPKVRRDKSFCRATGSMGSPEPGSQPKADRDANPLRQGLTSPNDYCQSVREMLVSCTGPEIDATEKTVPMVVNCIFGKIYYF